MLFKWYYFYVNRFQAALKRQTKVHINRFIQIKTKYLGVGQILSNIVAILLRAIESAFK